MLARATEFGFVGREAELAQLRAALDSTLVGHGRIVLLTGAPGIGKTRTARELTSQAEAADATVYWGRCSEERGAPPFWPWVQIVRAYLDDRTIETSRTDLGAGAPDLAMLVPELVDRLPELRDQLPVPPPPNGSIDMEQARFRLFESVRAFLANVTRREPLVLVLDNLHWADQPSLRLLEFLCQTISRQRLLVIGTYRDDEITRSHPLTDTLGELVKDSTFERLDLRGLSRSAARLVIAEAAESDPPESLVETVHRQTEGNPLFLGEIVRLLVQEEILSAHGHLARNDDHPPGPRRSFRIPAGIRETISRRLNRLSNRCNEVLAIASVIGREFGLTEISRLVPDSASVLDALDQAAGARVIEETTLVPLRYQFSHALIRETLYDDLTVARRLQLHATIGAMIEEVHGADLAPRLDELAHHFGTAMAVAGPAKALEYAERAGDRAMAMLAYEAAIPHYERALQALELIAPGETEPRCRLLLALGTAQKKAERNEPAMATLQQAADCAERLGLGEIQAQAALRFEEIAWMYGVVLHRSVELLTRALAALDPADSALRSTLLAAMARANYAIDQPERGRVLTQEAIAMARRIDDAAALVSSLRTSLYVLWQPGAIEEFVNSAVEQILFQAEHRTTDKLVQLIAYSHTNFADLVTGDLAAYKRSLERYNTLATDLRLLLHRYHIPLNDAMLSTLTGHFDEAERYAADALALGQRGLLNSPAGAYGLQMFTIRREQGRLSEIAPLVEQFVRLHPESSTWRPGLALIYRELDREPEARAVFEQLATNDFRDIPRDSLWCLTMVYLAEVCAYLGDAPRAGLLYDLLLPYAPYAVVGGNRAVCLGAVSHFLGLLAVTLGRPEDAARHFDHALAFNEKMGARPALAHSQVAYGRLLADSDRGRAETLLQCALATARDLGLRALEGRIARAALPAARRTPNPAGLSARELDVLRLLAAGRSNQEIAESLVISVYTVFRHVTHIYEKTESGNRAEATAFAIRHGLAP